MRSFQTSTKIILIHGNGGATASDHWFPWVRNELEKASGYYEHADQGHFGGDEKHIKTTFPELLKALLPKIQ